MIFNIPKDLKFSNYYKKLNLVSLIFVIFSVLIILFKGLNFGVDFKGGTLIEIRTEIQKPDIAEIRKSLLKMKLDNVTVKKFGQENDFLIKIDTNGFEFPIIRGLMQIIRKDRAAMIVESNQDIKKIDKMLKKLSYKSYYFSTNKKKLKLVNKKYPLNTFFLQKKHLP